MNIGPQFVTGTKPERTVFSGPVAVTGVEAAVLARGVAPTAAADGAALAAADGAALAAADGAALVAADGAALAATDAGAALAGAALAAVLGRDEGAGVAVGVPPHAARSNNDAPAVIPVRNCRRVAAMDLPFPTSAEAN